MKTAKFFSMVLILLSAFNHTLFPQEKIDIKKAVTDIIELSKAKKYDDAAKYVAFCSDEKKKEYKPLQPADKNQLNYVKRIVKRIGALAEVSTSYNIGNATSVNVGGNNFQKVSVEFISGDQKITSKFNFIVMNGTLLLAEVE